MKAALWSKLLCKRNVGYSSESQMMVLIEVQFAQLGFLEFFWDKSWSRVLTPTALIPVPKLLQSELGLFTS